MVGCGDGTSDPSPNNGTVQNNEPAASRTVQGRLTAEASGEAGVESKAITASRVDENGDQEEVATGETDADGKYSLELDAALTAGTTLLIEARDGEQLLGRVAFEASATAEGSVGAPPITGESTAEANVWLEASASGNVCAACTTADLAQRIDARVAAALNASADADVYAQFATSVYAGLEARSAMLLHASVGATQEQLDAAQASSSSAHAALTTSLSASTSDAELTAAQATYVEAYAQAYLDAGITTIQLAEAAQAEAGARASMTITADPETTAQIVANIESTRAAHVTAAVNAAFEAQGEANAEVESAGAELESSIEAAADAGADAQTQIDAAWASYSATVRVEVEAQLDIAQQTVLTGMDTSFEAGASAYATALAALETSGAAAGSVTALATLKGAIVADANVDALVTAGLSEEAAGAYLEVVFHLHAATAVAPN